MSDGATVAAHILAAAKFYNGGNYVQGGSNPGVGFDCSGFVQYLYGQAGISLPRYTFDQVNQGISVNQQDAAPGDLVFFNETGADAPGPGGSPWGHVGIYLGNGMMINAENPQAGIQITSVNGFSPVNQFVFRRVIPNYAGTGDTGVTTPSLSSLITGDASGTGGGSWTAPQVAATLGLSQAFFAANPELESSFQSAISSGLTPDTQQGQAEFQAILQNSAWYKSKTEAQRKWALLSSTDPAEARQQFVAAVANVAHSAASLGVQLNSNQEFVLASQAVSLGLTADELNFSIAAHLKVNNSGFYGGQAGKLADDLRSTAQNYGQPLSAVDVGKATFKILNGHATEDDFKSSAEQYAINMFPGAADAIKGGKTLSDVAQPYLSSYQSILEQNPQSVDLSKDPTIRKALAYQAPATTNGATNSSGTPAGQQPPTTQPLWQFEQSLKDDPRWLGTDNAQQSLAGAGVGVLKQLGLSV